jgi:hypothetical protein
MNSPILPLAIASLVAGPALAQDPAGQGGTQSSAYVSLTTGIDYSSGKYGGPISTDILVVPASLRLTSGRWRFSATLPYLRIVGAQSVVAGDGGPVVIDPNTPRVRRDGVGDLSLASTYAIPEDAFGLGIELTGRVKVPTASRSRGLGTGKTDFAVSAELSKTFGTITPFVEGGYRWIGSPSGVSLRNAPFASAGASMAFGKLVAIASYDYRGRTSDVSRSSKELFGALSGPLSRKVNWTFYGSAGLSSGAPDAGVGLMLSYKFT